MCRENCNFERYCCHLNFLKCYHEKHNFLFCVFVHFPKLQLAIFAAANTCLQRFLPVALFPDEIERDMCFRDNFSKASILLPEINVSTFFHVTYMSHIDFMHVAKKQVKHDMSVNVKSDETCILERIYFNGTGGIQIAKSYHKSQFEIKQKNQSIPFERHICNILS